MTPRADELLALGVPDVRAAGIPDAVEELLEDDHALMLGESEAGPRPARRAAPRLPELRALVEELEAFGSRRRSSTTTSTTDRSSFGTVTCESSIGATAASRTRSTR